MNPQYDPRISVVMITWNRRAETLSSLRRLAALPERPKIILVDNGSTDGTVAAVSADHPNVEIVGAGRNLGCAGRNLGVAHCDRPYIAFADDDTWWSPGSLRLAADLFDAHANLALVCARVVVEPSGVEDPTCSLMQNSPLRQMPGMPGPRLLGFLAGASAVRRSAFLEAGGFAASGIGGEEQWLAVELARRDGWMCYVPRLCVHHHPSLVRNERQRRQCLIRNALAFAWLRRPVRSALRVTAELAHKEPWDASTLRGLLSGAFHVASRTRCRRVVPAAVERDLCLLETQTMVARPALVAADDSYAA